ncbi:MAG: type II secretion system protein [Halioglobus sp.]|nr:type II secretion system protein [Halioglobus sp.]
MSERAVAMTGPPSLAAVRQRQRGFSLLELLVTLMVIVLVTSLVSFTVSSGGEEIRLEATVRNLAEVASYALDEAQMTGVDYGLLLEEDSEARVPTYSYSWLERELDGWGAPVSGKDLFNKGGLPPEIELELELEDAPLVELSLDEDRDAVEPVKPQIVFYASGEATVGAINVRERATGDLLWRIEWDLLGRFEVLRRGEAEEDW